MASSSHTTPTTNNADPLPEVTDYLAEPMELNAMGHALAIARGEPPLDGAYRIEGVIDGKKVAAYVSRWAAEDIPVAHAYLRRIAAEA